MPGRLSMHELQLRAITERDWQKTVEAMLTAMGWLWYHAPDNKPTAGNGRIQNIRAGFPDLVAVRGTRILFIELKRQTGKTTPEQDAWLERAAAAGAETYVWRPGDSARVSEVLMPRFAS